MVHTEIREQDRPDTTAGIMTLYALSGGFDQPAGIAAGSDGNLWFTSALGNVGRITPSGNISSFAVPKVGGNVGSLQDITAGPDGNLWFTVWYAYPTEKVGRITTSGTVTLVNVPTSGNGADTITSGPDGNLWFTEAFAYKIGVLAP